MYEELKLYEITPFMVGLSMKAIPREIERSQNRVYSYYSNYDRTKVILKLTNNPTVSALEMTRLFLPAFLGPGSMNGATPMENSAKFVYELLSQFIMAKEGGQTEVDLSSVIKEGCGGRRTFNFLAKVVNSSHLFNVLSQTSEPVPEPDPHSILPTLPTPKGFEENHSVELEFRALM